ncbi:MAG: GH92 family glycosyl hydrolase [Tannerellaceae bacterium]|jgi:predicted alpha-1,2-mannosidase|nr:GH92 family glycosyl hydrolase [Tannerellaceae bacterium]
MKLRTLLAGIGLAGSLLSCSDGAGALSSAREPVDYVNPCMGNISHLLVPTYPTVQLPNSMMRIFPARSGYTASRLNGLPLIVTNHRRTSSFTVTPFLENEDRPVRGGLNYDRERIVPYRYQVYLEDDAIEVDYAPSRQSAVYTFTFEKDGKPDLLFRYGRGKLTAENNTVSGYQQLNDKTKVYIYAEIDVAPEKHAASESSLSITIPENTRRVSMRYGISYISEEQAEKNLRKEISGYDTDAVAKAGRDAWNEALSRIKIEGGTEDEKSVFYTSLYRCYERPVNLSEDGYYFSAYDGKIHADEGRPFYTDDWIWDTYRAAHPLRVLINREAENDIIRSFLLMAEEKGTNWMPTFPEVTGDAHCMNSNHAVASVIDAYNKGLRGFDLGKAYLACREAIEGKSLIPWVEIPAGELDDFYREHGYFPALKPGEKETVSTVHSWEKRQPIAVTLGTSYDHWCLSLIARALGKTEDADLFLRRSYNYRNVFNPETGFFHPKDKEGAFIEGVDYRYSGGLGARDYYDENNGYIYRWDVQHNIGDLVSLIGGDEAFAGALDQMFNEPLGKSKWEFYATLPDHTGNVGQYSMANEPCLHIPYLYNYAGQPWKTQKWIRTLLNQWFRNDLMGMPGDEDGGGMSAFVVFSQMGFYPVTPGSPAYNIGSPVFSHVKMDLGNHTYFEIVANNASPENKYIQSATLNGKELNQAWFSHDEIKDGGLLVVEMGPKANKEWGKNTPPPSEN